MQSELFLIMPAFSKAIFCRVSPSISVWSKLIFVMIEISEFIAFVASSLPPRPVSSIIKSGFFSLK